MFLLFLFGKRESGIENIILYLASSFPWKKEFYTLLSTLNLEALIGHFLSRDQLPCMESKEKIELGDRENTQDYYYTI